MKNPRRSKEQETELGRLCKEDLEIIQRDFLRDKDHLDRMFAIKLDHEYKMHENEKKRDEALGHARAEMARARRILGFVPAFRRTT